MTELTGTVCVGQEKDKSSITVDVDSSTKLVEDSKNPIDNKKTGHGTQRPNSNMSNAVVNTFRVLTFVISAIHLILGIFTVDACFTAAYNYVMGVELGPYGGKLAWTLFVFLGLLACGTGYHGMQGAYEGSLKALSRALVWYLCTVCAFAWLASRILDYESKYGFWNKTTNTLVPKFVDAAGNADVPWDLQTISFMPVRLANVLAFSFGLNVVGCFAVGVAQHILKKQQEKVAKSKDEKQDVDLEKGARPRRAGSTPTLLG